MERLPWSLVRVLGTTLAVGSPVRTTHTGTGNDEGETIPYSGRSDSVSSESPVSSSIPTGEGISPRLEKVVLSIAQPGERANQPVPHEETDHAGETDGASWRVRGEQLLRTILKEHRPR